MFIDVYSFFGCTPYNQKYTLTISTAQAIDKEKLTLQHPEVQYLRRVEFQGRARLPSSIAASQHVHLTPHLKQRVVHTSAGQSCQALPVKLVGRRYRHVSLEAVEEERNGGQESRLEGEDD